MKNTVQLYDVQNGQKLWVVKGDASKSDNIFAMLIEYPEIKEITCFKPKSSGVPYTYTEAGGIKEKPFWSREWNIFDSQEKARDYVGTLIANAKNQSEIALKTWTKYVAQYTEYNQRFLSETK